MAHDTLKATIRQYIGPNGQNSITGQIMQDILIAMVDEYPDITGYATQAWVQQQGYVTASALSGYATQAWVNTQLGGYLPLTGGTVSGSITVNEGISTYSLTAYIISASSISIAGSGVATQSWVNTHLGDYLPLTGGDLSGSLSIQSMMTLGSATLHWEDEGEYCTLTFDHDGVELTAHGTGYFIANEFIKRNGTSDQFLKADGSVDSNTYITASALNGYATQAWVNTQLGGYLPLTGGTVSGSITVNEGISTYSLTAYIISASSISIAGSGVATQSWVNTHLGDYLPLTGGDLSGSLSIQSMMTLGSATLHWEDEGEYCTLTFDHDGVELTAHGTGYIIANEFIKRNGTSDQFLKADGSVDSNTYVTASALTGYATQAWVQNQGYITASALTGYATQSWVNTQLGSYLPLTGGTLTGDLTLNNGGEQKIEIHGQSVDGYGRIWVDSEGLNIGAYWTNSKTVSLGDDVYVSGGLDVNENLNVGSNAYIDSECRAASFIQTSDITKKNILGNVGLSLRDVANAPLFDFTWKDSEDRRNHVGTSAQYWQSVMPQVVSDTAETLGLQYDVTALACAITVAKTVVNHEERIKNLENKILS